MALLALLFEDGGEGGEDEAEVGEQRGVGDVLEVDGEFVGHDAGDVALLGIFGFGQELVLMAVADGGQGGDAGTHVEDVHLLGRVHLDIVAHLGTRAHEAHVADEDVDELGQFVEFVAADDVAGAGDARVAATDGDEAAAVGAGTHAAEFVETEVAAAASYAHLTVEDGAA